jgi:hypothetical protein
VVVRRLLCLPGGEDDPKEETAMGYIIAWLLGVPAAVLAVIWLINNG